MFSVYVYQLQENRECLLTAYIRLRDNRTSFFRPQPYSTTFIVWSVDIQKAGVTTLACCCCIQKIKSIKKQTIDSKELTETKKSISTLSIQIKRKKPKLYIQQAKYLLYNKLFIQIKFLIVTAAVLKKLWTFQH